MTRLGLNAGGAYTAALHRHPDAHALLSTPAPATGPTSTSPSARLCPGHGRRIEL